MLKGGNRTKNRAGEIDHAAAGEGSVPQARCRGLEEEGEGQQLLPGMLPLPLARTNRVRSRSATKEKRRIGITFLAFASGSPSCQTKKYSGRSLGFCEEQL